ncbi:MAG: carboxypeptidase M32 [Gammaproteobacteria bacterium]
MSGDGAHARSQLSEQAGAYGELVSRYRQIHRLEHARAIVSWDQAAKMPPKGNDARGAALAELATLLHGLRTAPVLAAALDSAEQTALADEERANVREMRRDWLSANALPAALVERRELAIARCEHAWRSQRPANDWAGFLENFRSLLALVREQAARLADRTGLAPYDALIDQFEPGMTAAAIESIFSDLGTWLPGLIRDVRARQQHQPIILPRGPFPVAGQRALCERVMSALGFDFGAGRLDVSAHPFCGGVPEDVRITTRFSADDFLRSLMGTIHETGHARYEQNLPRAWLGQPVALARSMAIHESQSLSFEMQLGRHRGFVAWLAPLIEDTFGADPAFAPQNLHRLITRVQPDRIRVDADEVTYPAHIVLRFEIERALIEQNLPPEEIPALWDRHMAQWLDVDTRGDYRDGPLQDVHWPSGLFGYFPCYSLGAMYAAQWFAAIRSRHADLDQRIAAGDFAVVFDRLKAQVWDVGSRYPTAELCTRASGRVLDPGFFRAHLTARYLND